MIYPAENIILGITPVCFCFQKFMAKHCVGVGVCMHMCECGCVGVHVFVLILEEQPRELQLTWSAISFVYISACIAVFA